MAQNNNKNIAYSPQEGKCRTKSYFGLIQFKTSLGLDESQSLIGHNLTNRYENDSFRRTQFTSKKVVIYCLNLRWIFFIMKKPFDKLELISLRVFDPLQFNISSVLPRAHDKGRKRSCRLPGQCNILSQSWLRLRVEHKAFHSLNVGSNRSCLFTNGFFIRRLSNFVDFRSTNEVYHREKKWGLIFFSSFK